MDIWVGDIRQDWDMVRPILYNMLQGHDERPEDVYSACVSGKAIYFCCEDGFIVLQENINTVTNEKELFVVSVARWPDSKSTIKESLFKKYEPKLIEMAQSINAKNLSFGTLRPGYERLLSSDWKKKVIYSRRV